MENGYGILNYDNILIYEGEFNNGERNGIGQFKKYNKKRYEGECYYGIKQYGIKYFGHECKY